MANRRPQGCCSLPGPGFDASGCPPPTKALAIIKPSSTRVPCKEAHAASIDSQSWPSQRRPPLGLFTGPGPAQLAGGGCQG